MPAKTRVLLLTPDFPPAPGGIQLLMHRLATNMTITDPVVVAPGGKGSAEFDRVSPVSVHRVRVLPVNHRANILWLNAAALQIASRARPDVVLSAHIVTSPAANMISRRLGVPFVQYVHANEVGARLRLARFALTRCAAAIVVSRHTAELSERAGASPAIIHRIPPGVDLPDRQTVSRSARPTIITVARLEDSYKGHDMVIRALPLIRVRVPDVQWIVIGSGPRCEQLVQLAEIYGVSDCVQFLGTVSDQERDAWLERADVFAMPSRVPGDGLGGEGFGIVYMEASWRGLPVVAGDRGGAVDAVADGQTGVLVDATDAVAVAEALTDLLLDPELARRLGQQGTERAKEFAWPLIARRVEDVLLSV
jgi:phosphatidylinositol alpha-1,6-mannosyltransferase